MRYVAVAPTRQNQSGAFVERPHIAATESRDYREAKLIII